jgi:hypothetical protein
VLLFSATFADLMQSARNYATPAPTAAFAGQKGSNVSFPFFEITSFSPLFMRMSLGKIHCHADSRRWYTSQIAFFFLFNNSFAGIGPEISQSVKDIYAAAKVD